MKNKPLLVILALAAMLRLVGIGYGLPLWLVGDEPAFVFGALKMMELKTLIPALHHADFIGTFYYTPYLSHLYLLPFAVVAGIKLLFFSGTFAEFTQFLQIDLSHFFLAARLISAAVGTATVYVIYRIGKNIFGQERPALFAAAFFAFSFLHVNFSHWGRHWVPVTFIFSIVLFCLSHPSWSSKKRYLAASLATGIGMGVSQQVGLITLCIALWFFIVDRFPLRALRERWPWMCVGMFLFLSLIAYLLWPPGFYVAAGAGHYIARTPKTLAGFMESYTFYAKNLATSEPVMLIFLIAGSVIAIKARHRVFLALSLFGIAYIAAFYFLFLQTDRFLLMLYPAFAITIGFAWTRIQAGRIATAALFALLLLPIIRYDMLLIKNDTRARALGFIEKNIPAGTKVLVLAPLMRLPATAEAITEQEAIDPASIRSVDRAERALPNAPPLRFHALNVYQVRNVDFLANIEEYTASNGYEYVIYEPMLAAERVGDAFDVMGEEVARFAGYNESRGDSIVNGIGDGVQELSTAHSLGPDIIIKKL